MKVFGIHDIQGGVGKTATAINLAYLATAERQAHPGVRPGSPGRCHPLLSDKTQSQGGSKALVRGKRELDATVKGTDFENLDLLPVDFSFNLDLALEDAKQLSRLLDPLAAEYAYVFLDCPPGISLVAENILRTADVLLVPVIPTTLSMWALDRLLEFLRAHPGAEDLRVMPLLTMVDRRKRLHQELIDHLSAPRWDNSRPRFPMPRTWNAWASTASPLPAYALANATARAYGMSSSIDYEGTLKKSVPELFRSLHKAGPCPPGLHAAWRRSPTSSSS